MMASLGKVLCGTFFTNTSLRVLRRYPMCTSKRFLSQSKIVNNLNLQTCRVPVVRTNLFLCLKFWAVLGYMYLLYE